MPILLPRPKRPLTPGLRLQVLAALALSLTALSLTAFAHPGLLPREARIGAPYRAAIAIPHGCDGSATVRLRVVIPEGVVGVKPMAKPGWTISTVRGPYERNYVRHGKTLTEGVKEVIWSGRLSDDLFDEFVFSVFLAETLPAGQMLYFPTDQACEKGEIAWTQVPAPGQDEHALPRPAPRIMLLPAAERTAAGASDTYKVGTLVIEAPWVRATPAGAQAAAGYLKVTNTGKAPDRLMGGVFPFARAVEVHEMTVSGGVARMRQLEQGLEIAPGKTVELKPGGNHLMLLGLSETLKEGQTVKGRLLFEKAGAVDVELGVASIGAQSPGRTHRHHH